MNSQARASSTEARPTATGPRLLGVWILTLALLVVAALGWIAVAPRLSPVAPHPWPWWSLVLLFVAAKHLRFELAAAGSEPITLVMTDAAIVVALLLAEPRVIPIGLAAAVISVPLIKRTPLIKALFNISQELVGAFLGLILFQFTRDSHLVSARTGFAALLGGAAVGIFSHYAVALVTRLAGGIRHRASLRSLFLSSLGSLGNGVVALQIVYLGSINPVLTAIPALLLFVLVTGYRSLRTQQQITDRSDLLYRTTAALHEKPNLDDGLLEVLEQVRLALRSETARVVLLTGEGAATCAASSIGLSPMTSASPHEEIAALRLASELPGSTIVRRDSPHLQQGPLTEFLTDEAIVTPILRGETAAGIVYVSGRISGADSLGERDADLVELLAKQIGLVLEKGHLEQSLSQLRDLEQQLTRQAYFDAVTGLANRNFLSDELARLCSEVRVGLSAVYLVDLDDFKTVNDTLGHIAGDSLLAIMADRLVSVVEDSGVVARIGGDEFAVVVRDIGDTESALLFGQRIIDALSQTTSLHAREIAVSASIGVRLVATTVEIAEDLLRDADLALYTAKSHGKACARLFVAEMRHIAEERLALTAALSTAVERDEFSLVYQPIVELESGKISGAEALVRWRHPERGEVGPTGFLTFAEESGLIVVLGRQILRKALAALRNIGSGPDDFPFYMSVNISPRQLREPDFAQMVLTLLREFGIPGTRLVLEITESMVVEDLDRTRSVLQTLGHVGVRFSLDDFGTGYSSLSQLQDLPFHQLKIDQSFVRRLSLDGESRVVVGAIIHLAHALSLETVAEGIEFAAQRDDLRALGCKRGQGWLYSKPIAERALHALLNEPPAGSTGADLNTSSRPRVPLGLSK